MRGVVALTGATGFIGKTVMRRLVGAGRRVRALYRQPLPPRSCAGDGAVEWVRGSLEDRDSLERLLDGVEAVVHCAGRVRGVDGSHFNGVNIDGVARLVHAARQVHGSPRFLAVSSLAAREPHLSPYAASKLGGERVLAAESGSLSWVALRPPAVYGPGDREIAPVLKMMVRGIAPAVAPQSARFSMIFVEDLVEAMIALLEQPVWKGQCFELHDGQPGGYCWADVIRTVSRITGRPVLALGVPRIVLRSLARMNVVGARLFGYAPMLTPGKVHELIHPDWTCTNENLSRETGWTPRTFLPDGLRQTLACLSPGYGQTAPLN